jgi:hypothetical protein
LLSGETDPRLSRRIGSQELVFTLPNQSQIAIGIDPFAGGVAKLLKPTRLDLVTFLAQLVDHGLVDFGVDAANALLDQLKADQGTIWKDESNYQIIK